MVERCLVKDPSLRSASSSSSARIYWTLTVRPLFRPTAAQLLQTPFFRNAKKRSYLVGTILRPSAPHPRLFFSLTLKVWLPAGDLPPLAQRLERRKQSSLLLQGTVDSWDFPTTLLTPSPIQSVFRRLRHSASVDEKGKKEETADGRQPKEEPDAERETTPWPTRTDSPPNAVAESRPLLLPSTRTPSNAHLGYVATTTASAVAGPGLPSADWQPWTSPALPAAPSISVSVSASSNQTSSSPRPSLWHRIRRSPLQR
jgi:serine/threonine-protein kinase OSR1/STK39